MPAPRLVRELSEAEVSELDQGYCVTNNADMLTRCHVVLLSAKGYSTPEVAKLVHFSAGGLCPAHLFAQAEWLVATSHPLFALPTERTAARCSERSP